jgi:hypothetical protein
MWNALVIGTNLSSYILANELRRLEDINKIYIAGEDVRQIGLSKVNEFIKINISFDADVSILVELIEKYNIRYIIPGAHDVYLNIYSRLKDILDKKKGLHADFERLHNKSLFRIFLSEKFPKFNPVFHTFSEGVIVADQRKALDFNKKIYLGKPNHAGGGRGISLINSESELNGYVSSVKFGVIEEFHYGVDLSISIFLDRQQTDKITFYADREFTNRQGFRITASISSYNFLNKIKDMGIVQKLADISTILSSSKLIFMHFQIRFIDFENWIIIEATERMPGDAYSIIPEIYLGFQYNKLYLSKYMDNIDSFSKLLYKKYFLKNDDFYFGRLCSSSNNLSDINIIMSYKTSLIANKDSYEVKIFEKNIHPDLNLFDPKFKDIFF